MNLKAPLRLNAYTLHRFNAISPVNQYAFAVEPVPPDDWMLQTILHDVGPELGEFLVRHHGEDVGGGVDLEFFAPLAHRHTLRSSSMSSGTLSMGMVFGTPT